VFSVRHGNSCAAFIFLPMPRRMAAVSEAKKTKSTHAKSSDSLSTVPEAKSDESIGILST